MDGACFIFNGSADGSVSYTHLDVYKRQSYGCLIGTHARDKDAIVATMALCEAAAYYKSKGMNLWDAMVAMYDRYGY